MKFWKHFGNFRNAISGELERSKPLNPFFIGPCFSIGLDLERLWIWTFVLNNSFFSAFKKPLITKGYARRCNVVCVVHQEPTWFLFLFLVDSLYYFIDFSLLISKPSRAIMNLSNIHFVSPSLNTSYKLVRREETSRQTSIKSGINKEGRTLCGGLSTQSQSLSFFCDPSQRQPQNPVGMMSVLPQSNSHDFPSGSVGIPSLGKGNT